MQAGALAKHCFALAHLSFQAAAMKPPARRRRATSVRATSGSSMCSPCMMVTRSARPALKSMFGSRQAKEMRWRTRRQCTRLCSPAHARQGCQCVAQAGPAPPPSPPGRRHRRLAHESAHPTAGPRAQHPAAARARPSPQLPSASCGGSMRVGTAAGRGGASTGSAPPQLLT